MTAIILDTETTDKVEGEVIELAHASFDIAAGVGTPWVGRYAPKKNTTYGALAVHHILPEELIGKPPSDLARTEVPPVDYWIGHNIDFDWKALGQPKIKRICTLALARSLYPDLDSHTQTALMYFFFGSTDATRTRLKDAHSAGADILMCADILKAMLPKLGVVNLSQLWEASEDARIPRKMTFGKFAGQPISAVDRGYSNWYRRQPDPDPYLLEAFKRAGI